MRVESIMKKLPLLACAVLGCWTSASVLVAQTESNASPNEATSPDRNAPANEDNKPQVLKTSPSGAFRVVQTGEEFWIVSGANENQRTRMHSEELVIPEEFCFSPDENWLYVELHHGSCMAGADLYRRSDKGRFDRIEPPLEDRAWAEALKQHLYSRNFAEEGLCAMVRFGGWSDDSARLLLIIRGGEERRETVARYLYYNTRTEGLELTPYLKKVNAATAKLHDADILACAEPVDALPEEATLKQRLADADKKLNENYQKMISKAEKEEKQSVAELRRSQREWLKARDAGLQLYLAAVPPAEKERRRLQFLADVTQAQIATADAR